ncbi:TPA: type II toxin-antitoxin system HicA family toxin [Enterococcus faecalis]|nr:addiction module toxin, HicA family [Enterococcus faecalis]EIT2196969.1 type II toxin-antitoxin system HicA family toxin [Enterococcus faecalis]HBI1784002.1 type II toxin-antitoxin system HicA family toxin [Enterococcus faecalis]HBI1786594.1 type II toxin-antitoxin system HicA family toxin [Enterococcus faecalis]HBI1791980.1 type II toxin-antitoxin system HicA family toxin [Enterococcus faecalis]
MLKLLRKNGWIERRQESSRHQLYKNGVRITVPVHGNHDLGRGLEREILMFKNPLAKAYPAVFIPEPKGGYFIEFPDIQGAYTGINFSRILTNSIADIANDIAPMKK